MEVSHHRTHILELDSYPGACLISWHLPYIMKLALFHGAWLISWSLPHILELALVSWSLPHILELALYPGACLIGNVDTSFPFFFFFFGGGGWGVWFSSYLCYKQLQLHVNHLLKYKLSGILQTILILIIS